MIITQSVCAGCSAVVPEEDHDSGVQECSAETCGRYGRPLMELKKCTECDTIFLPHLTHRHGTNMMPRFKLPAPKKQPWISMDQLMEIQSLGGEING